MKQRPDYYLKNIILGSIGVIGITVILMISYLDNHDIKIGDLSEWDNVHVSISDGFIDEDYSNYDTKDVYEENVFSPLERMRITLVGDDLTFIHEDREDIKIVYNKQIPDTSKFQLDYSAKEIGSVIDVKVSLNISNLVEKGFKKGEMTIYVPLDYQCEKLTVNNPYGDNDLVLPENLEELYYTVNFGNMILDIDQPLTKADLSVNAGNMDVHIKDTIDQVSLNIDTGELDAKFYDEVSDVTIDNNIGSTSVSFKRSPDAMTVTANMGDLYIETDEPIVEADVTLNMGDLTMNISDDDQGLVYIDKSLSSVQNVLHTTSDKREANIVIELDMGDVTVRR